MNACLLRRKQHNELTFPSKVFGYLALCERLKQNIGKIMEKSIVTQGNLPFVSQITSEYSPQGAVHIHWSFLKY